MLHTKYTVRNKRPSYAFLMEMLWVCGFFAIASCIFVMAFAKADSMSRKAQDLNEAVMAAEQEMEQTFLSEREGTCLPGSGLEACFRRSGRTPAWYRRTVSGGNLRGSARYQPGRRQTFKRVHSGGRPCFRIHPGNHLHAGGKPYDRKRGGRA